MAIRINLVGQKYGRLTVVSEAKPHITPKGRKVYYWNCKCDCGNMSICSTSALRSGNSQSCGCLQKEIVHDALFNDLTGKRFGRLVALSPYRKDGIFYWKCKCDCGKYHDVLAGHLTSGKILSCGCLRSDVSSVNTRTHGISKTRIYKIWKGMKYRCYAPQSPVFKDYGGRGIKVCDAWLNNPEAFYNWSVSHGYKDGLTVDRINVDGDYSPENCRWTDYKTQANNTRRNVLVEYNGEMRTMKQWSEYAGINYQTFVRRIKAYGWSIDDAINIPVGSTRRPCDMVEVFFNGE